MIVVFDLRQDPDEPPQRSRVVGPERCEGCGWFVMLDADGIWQEIHCTCALRDLEKGLRRERWCYEVPHTPERCRQHRAHTTLPPLEVEP